MCWSRRDPPDSAPRNLPRRRVADASSPITNFRRSQIFGTRNAAVELDHSEPVENFPAVMAAPATVGKSLLADFFAGRSSHWAEAGHRDLSNERPPFSHDQAGRAVAAPLESSACANRREFPAPARAGRISTLENGEWEVPFTTSQGTVVLPNPRRDPRPWRRIVAANRLGRGWVKLFADAGSPSLRSLRRIAVTKSIGRLNFWRKRKAWPLKNVVVRAGGESVAGECSSPIMGWKAARFINWPRVAHHENPRHRNRSQTRLHRGATRRQNTACPGIHLLDQAIRAWRLSRVAAPFSSFASPSHRPGTGRTAKAYPLALRGPRPIEEAISTAGGVS